MANYDDDEVRIPHSTRRHIDRIFEVLIDEGAAERYFQSLQILELEHRARQKKIRTFLNSMKKLALVGAPHYRPEVEKLTDLFTEDDTEDSPLTIHVRERRSKFFLEMAAKLS